MVSGIFFLSPNRNVTVGKIWGKNIAKLVSAYIFWCFVYAIYNKWFTGHLDSLTPSSLIKGALNQPFHMWYIPMLISLYVITPFVRLITANAKESLYKYGLALLILALSLNTISSLPEIPYFEYIDRIITRTPALEICGYVSFFILGYYLYTFRPGAAMRKKIYALGLLSIIVSGVFCVIMNMHGMDTWDYHLFAKLTITTFGKNTAIFIFILTFFSRVNFSERGKKILVKLSNYTLIVYLVHIIILKQIIYFGIMCDESWNPAVATVLQSIIAYAIGIAIAFVFHRVPWKDIKVRLLGALNGKAA
jgi:surface polysaccharide O-acyltransferase-like enzyme